MIQIKKDIFLIKAFIIDQSFIRVYEKDSRKKRSKYKTYHLWESTEMDCLHCQLTHPTSFVTIAWKSTPES